MPIDIQLEKSNEGDYDIQHNKDMKATSDKTSLGKINNNKKVSDSEKTIRSKSQHILEILPQFLDEPG